MVKGQPGRAPLWRFSLRPTFQPYWQGVGWRLPGASGQGRGLWRGFARPWPPRRAAAARSALPPSARRGPRACAGRFFTQQQGLPGQLLAHWQPARGLSAQPGARPPAQRLRHVGGHVEQPPQRPDPLREPRQQPLQSSSRKCSWSAAPAWLVGGVDRQPDAAGDRAGVGGVQRGRLRPLVARRQLHLSC